MTFDPRWFPITLIVLDFAAALAYAWVFDWRRATYWTAAAILTLTVTI